jgi:hypothetical protein
VGDRVTTGVGEDPTAGLSRGAVEGLSTSLGGDDESIDGGLTVPAGLAGDSSTALELVSSER